MSHPIVADKNPPSKGRFRQQQPGLTAKGDQRRFVKHNYIDHAYEEDDLGGVYGITVTDRYQLLRYNTNGNEVKNTKPSPPFPLKLWMIIDEVGDRDKDAVISWLPHGRGFFIRNSELFGEQVLPIYFKKCKISSFFRQLNLYGFIRLTSCHETIAYYHEYFLRGKPHLTMRIIRTKVKGTKIRAASSPQDEPNFFSMTPLPDPPGKGEKKRNNSALPSTEDQTKSTYVLHQNQSISLQQRRNMDYNERRNMDYNELMSAPRLSNDPHQALSSMMRYNDLTSFPRKANGEIFGTMHGSPLSANVIGDNLASIMSTPKFHHYLPVVPNSIKSNTYSNCYHSFPFTHPFSVPNAHLRGDTILRNTSLPLASNPHYHELAYSSNALAFGQGDMDINKGETNNQEHTTNRYFS